MSLQNPDSGSTNSGVAVEDKALDKESVIELLGEEDKEEETLQLEEPPKKPAKVEEKKDKEGTEKPEETEEEPEPSLEDELEEELKEVDDEEELEVAPPSRKEILAAFPELFKKFPHIEKAIYRERRYAEILPTIEDAKTAVEKSSSFDQYEKDILAGSTETLLSSVRDNDKEAFAKVVDNYLPTLHKVDPGAYFHTIGNVIKHTIISMVRDAKDQSNEELESAAAVLNNYIFGTNNFTHPTKLSQEEVSTESREKENEISQREKNFLEKQYNTARDNLGTKVDNILKNTVDKAIDPSNSMSGFVKKFATHEVLTNLENLISKDTRFKAIYDRLWERAFDNDFDTESLDKLKKAYLSKAKTLLPTLIKNARNEALKDSRKKVTDDTKERDRKGPLPVGKIRSSTTLTSGKPHGSDAKQQIPKGMTTLEFLSKDD